MWLFLPSGLLMPAAVPAKADPELTDNGRRDIQVRGRIESHLTNFIRDYMEPMGLDYSEIEHTPQMDYNVRFYTTKEEFAQAIARATLDIDYLKFKPTAENKNEDGELLYKDGKAYHSVLNSIWGTVTRLAPAGGVWSANRTLGNKNYPSWSGYGSVGTGYTPSSPTSSRFDDYDWYKDERPEHHFDYAGYQFEDEYVPSNIERGSELYMDNRLWEIPEEEWADFFEDSDLAMIRDYLADVKASTSGVLERYGVVEEEEPQETMPRKKSPRRKRKRSRNLRRFMNR